MNDLDLIEAIELLRCARPIIQGEYNESEYKIAISDEYVDWVRELKDLLNRIDTLLAIANQ